MLYTESILRKKIKSSIMELGIDLGKLLEENPKELIFQKLKVRPPGFEPGQRAREARVLPG